jgi:hypothetical protein
MPIQIKPFTEELIPGVVAFNQRLKTAGIKYQFPEHHEPSWLPRLNGRKIYQELFLAVENDRDVRGAFALKHQEFSLNGETVSLGTLLLPLSEGIVNKTYASTGVQILLNAFERKALFYALGIGSHQEPLAVILMKLGWTIATVPFYFRVERPFQFFRKIAHLRSSRLNRALLDLLAWSGAGWVAVTLLNVLRSKRRSKGSPFQTEVIEEFGNWVDPLWDACKRDYGLCGVRDSATLKALYPRSEQRFIRLKVSQDGKEIGWAVLLDTQMTGSKYFGDMRVGSVVDCMALRKDANLVIRAAAQQLKLLGVDIIVSNQLDAAWGTALKNCGFMSGPSNFLFAASKKLVERLQPFRERLTSIHMTRGDGDGPINL